MTRTRVTFFIILGAILGIVGLSTALQLIQSTAMLQVYSACAFFGLGVTVLDFVGIFGGESGDGSIEGGADGAIDGGADGDGGDLALDGDMSIDGDGAIDGEIAIDDGGIDGTTIDGTAFDGADTSEANTSGHIIDSNISDIDMRRGGRVLSILAYLRMTVYFALGFGPTGWMALVLGYSPLGALLLASAIGVIALFLAQAFFRFQRSDTDSSLRSHELLSKPATVTIPLTDRTMGKVRIQVGMSVTEQYALATQPEAAFNKGDTVHVMKVTDECVYVA